MNSDVVIVGGGLAGLSLAILLAQGNISVRLIEKDNYPRHKVCGEYISMESWSFIKRLGVDLDHLDLPRINYIKISSVDNKMIESGLDSGGFGISRYLLEKELFDIATSLGVQFELDCKFKGHSFSNNIFSIQTSNGNYNSKVLCAAFGKYAAGDFHKPQKQKENWVGVKYHIDYKHNQNEIVLHNFEGGYCGMSAIENNKSCLCYLVNAKVLAKFKGDIKSMEKEVLKKNEHLSAIFNEAQFLFQKPQVISNVTFEVKKPTNENVFYLGDSAGAIAPLSGNGMSNAFRSAHLLHISLTDYLNGQLSLLESLAKYDKDWRKAMSARIEKGRFIQNFFCKKNLNRASIRILSLLPFLHQKIIKQTHGESF